MKNKVLAGLVVAGVLGISGAAFAGTVVRGTIDIAPAFAAKTQSQKLPPKFDEKRPPLSRDNRLPPPPGAHSPDKRPQKFDGKRPPMPPMSRDNRMPPPSGAHTPDKRPQEFRK